MPSLTGARRCYRGDAGSRLGPGEKEPPPLGSTPGWARNNFNNASPRGAERRRTEAVPPFMFGRGGFLRYVVPMHPEPLNWIRTWARAHPSPLRHVLELGAQDINGSPRQAFPAGVKRWVGVDVFERPGVDWTGLCHEYPAKGWDGVPFDALVTTEMLEHDPHWRLSLLACLPLVRPGGAVLLTCASGSRPPHGVDHDTPTPGYYRNLFRADLEPVLAASAVKGRWCIDRGGMDLYFAGARAEDPRACVVCLSDEVREALGPRALAMVEAMLSGG